MSITSSGDDPHHQMTSSPAFIHILTHVFLPVYPPDKNDNTPENEHSLARAVCAAARAYGTHVSGTSEQPQWNHITKMLDNLQASVHMENDRVISQLRAMQMGGTFAGFPHIPALTTSRYPRIFCPSSKCRDYPHEAGELHAVRSIRGIPKQRCCRGNARASDMLLSWIGDRDPQRRVRRSEVPIRTCQISLSPQRCRLRSFSPSSH